MGCDALNLIEGFEVLQTLLHYHQIPSSERVQGKAHILKEIAMQGAFPVIAETFVPTLQSVI